MKKFKPTYLYIKEHKDTGLKYFGKTVRKNPYVYKGSGIYWTRHLAEHGNNVTTTVLNKGRPFTDEKIMKKVALAFSIKHNIVSIVLIYGEAERWVDMPPIPLNYIVVYYLMGP